MSKIYLSLLVFCVLYCSAKAQITTDASTGDVGIGTTTPQKRLHVNGSSLIQGSLSFSLYSNGYSGALAFNRDADNGAIYNPALSGFQINGRPTWLEFQVYNPNGSGVTSNALSINNLGNVGVATSSPISTFQVEEGCTKASIGEAAGSSALNWGTSYLGFNAARDQNQNWALSNDQANHNGGGIIYGAIFGNIYFAPLGTTTGSGSDQNLSDANIASSIALKISPNGTTYAKQVVVQATAFPDYVFKTTYRLMPLNDLKNYVDKNHHLPEVPSAAEVEKDGLNLGEMNKLLFKKVEELTLYLIDKDKELKEQKERIDRIETELKILKRN